MSWFAFGLRYSAQYCVSVLLACGLIWLFGDHPDLNAIAITAGFITVFFAIGDATAKGENGDVG